MVCCQRPRKLGAKYTGHDIAPDEHVQPNLDFDYEGKRDRWNGYDSATYRHVVDDYQKLEDAKRQLKAQKIEAALMDGAVDESLAEVQLCCCCNCYCSHTLFFVVLHYIFCWLCGLMTLLVGCQKEQLSFRI